mmetsp:Transcript_31671/g.71555  ORF Transcript_31671/g.71555 Transcript_31671/m.71555 type:complete len:111 (-) Transcript_31671:653-985(-)
MAPPHSAQLEPSNLKEFEISSFTIGCARPLAATSSPWLVLQIDPSGECHTSSAAGTLRTQFFGMQRIASCGGSDPVPVAVATIPKAVKSLVGGTGIHIVSGSLDEVQTAR